MSSEKSLEYWKKYAKNRTKNELAELIEELHAKHLDAEYSFDQTYQALDTLRDAVEAECKKFSFPDEDRPELWEAYKKVENI